MNNSEYLQGKKKIVIDNRPRLCYDDATKIYINGGKPMKHIQSIETRDLCQSAKNGGCGECQTSCQSACKTSCGIANQTCENKK